MTVVRQPGLPSLEAGPQSSIVVGHSFHNGLDLTLVVLLVLEEGPVYKRSDVKLVCRPEPILLIPDCLEVSPLN